MSSGLRPLPPVRSPAGWQVAYPPRGPRAVNKLIAAAGRLSHTRVPSTRSRGSVGNKVVGNRVLPALPGQCDCR